jgi:hypothetical protein
MRPLVLALALAAAAAAAQDYPVDPPGGDEPTPPTTPPAGIALPEMLPPAPELVTPLAILDRLVVPGTRLQLEWRPAGGISNAEIASPVVVARGAMGFPAR